MENQNIIDDLFDALVQLTPIQAKDLKIGDHFFLIDAGVHFPFLICKIIDLDPEGKRVNKFFKNRVLIVDAHKQVSLDKNSSVIKYTDSF